MILQTIDDQYRLGTVVLILYSDYAPSDHAVLVICFISYTKYITHQGSNVRVYITPRNLLYLLRSLANCCAWRRNSLLILVE